MCIRQAHVNGSHCGVVGLDGELGEDMPNAIASWVLQEGINVDRDAIHVDGCSSTIEIHKSFGVINAELEFAGLRATLGQVCRTLHHYN